jgi:hypothetical protein
MIHRLILIQTRKDNRLLPRRGINVALQTLRADFLHHALHRRVDAGNGRVVRLQ